MKEARSFSVLGPLMGGFGSQAFLGCVHDVGAHGPVLRPAVFVFIPDDVVEDPERFKKLWQETEFAGEIDHVNVIGVMGLAKLDEGYARVVEYADAESLRSVYRRAQTMKRPLTPDIAVAIVADACMGVHYAHELGDTETGQPWIHGGVRPETLQVSFAGMAKVTGYGAQVLADSIRKKGATGMVTRDTYTAPEQAFGGRASSTVQSDVYALGCILYEALTGKPPFSGDKDLAEAMIKDELSRPSLVGVTPAMAEVVLKATQRRAADRYATALDMRMDIFERCEPANEGDIKRYLDDLFPPNAIPRATRIQMLRKAQAEQPEPSGQLLTTMPTELTTAHTARASTPNDIDVEARTGQTVDDLRRADPMELLHRALEHIGQHRIGAAEGQHRRRRQGPRRQTRRKTLRHLRHHDGHPRGRAVLGKSAEHRHQLRPARGGREGVDEPKDGQDRKDAALQRHHLSPRHSRLHDPGR